MVWQVILCGLLAVSESGDWSAPIRAQQLFHEVYGKRIEAAKTPEAKAVLAKEILELAKKEADQTAKLVELENAKNLAIDANAAALAVEITKELAQLSKDDLSDDPLTEAERLWADAHTLSDKLKAIELYFRSRSHGITDVLWTRRIDSVATNGGLVLYANSARLIGARIRYSGDLDGILDWVTPGDYIEWDTDVPSGTFTVVIEYAADHASAYGSLFAISVREQNSRRITSDLSFRLVNTGQWPTFARIAVGKITVKRAGPATISMRVVQKTPPVPNMGIISLRSLRFVRH